MQKHLPKQKQLPQVQVHAENFVVSEQHQKHLPNWANRVGDALVMAILAMLPDEYQNTEIREGTYISSDANIVYRQTLPGIGEVITFSQREGGTRTYVFEDNSALPFIVGAAEI